MRSAYWAAGGAVYGLHMGLLVLMAAGALAAAAGWLARRRRLSLSYWPLLAGTSLSQLLPSCPLTQLEYWLRRHDVPDYQRTLSVANGFVHLVTRAWLPEWAITAILIAILALSAYAWFRYHSGAA
ncbi:MAG: DUF2784 family protein [Dehalococcoidia bacterium]|nr:DUF2784 family protein [Dehalococcoidia bacterium]